MPPCLRNVGRSSDPSLRATCTKWSRYEHGVLVTGWADGRVSFSEASVFTVNGSGKTAKTKLVFPCEDGGSVVDLRYNRTTADEGECAVAFVGVEIASLDKTRRFVLVWISLGRGLLFCGIESQGAIRKRGGILCMSTSFGVDPPKRREQHEQIYETVGVLTIYPFQPK